MVPISRRSAAIFCLFALAAFFVFMTFGPEALAQARNPFNVGISEGGGAPSGGVMGWVFAQQIAFERTLSGAVRAIKSDVQAVWALMGLSFAYGVFHAAGPGHGKAVVASYMIANERALRRGIAISFFAAILQGLVAIAIVGVLAYLLNATAQRMKSAANLVELASFGGVALLGLWLVWRKGRALANELLPASRKSASQGVHKSASQALGSHDHHHDHHHAREHAAAHLHSHDHDHGHEHDHEHDHGHAGHAHKPAHGEPGHVHDEHCGHFHAPDPKTLGDSFSWGTALATVATAGARPCSGAILILVFAFAQGIFLAGVAATFAMALGTAITTGALAAFAVLAKGMAMRFAGEGGRRGALFVRFLELAAAIAILLLGATLLGASLIKG